MQDQILIARHGFKIACLVAATLLSSSLYAEDQLAPADGNTVDELESKPGDDSDELLVNHAKSYAADYNVSLDEAMRRLRLMETLEDTLSKLEVAARDRFAGAWIEHEPKLRAVVRLAGDSKELSSDAQSIVKKSPAPIEIVSGAESTLSQLMERVESTLPKLQAKHIRLAGAEVDVKSGEIVLFIEEDKATEEAIKLDAKELLQLPVRIESVDAPVGDGHTRGGAHLSSCTSGFVVRHPSTGTRGYITAGHCGNNQTYFEYGGVSYSTTFIDEIRDANQDVQWHTTPHIEQPRFYAGGTTTHRPLRAKKNRSSQAVGGYVCHRGKTTGYSCGNIASKTFQPTYPNACPGVTCASVWVRVEGPSLKCFPGDSGGPWFLVYTAYGIYKGQSSSGTSAADCNWAFYMAANYFGIDLVYD